MSEHLNYLYNLFETPSSLFNMRDDSRGSPPSPPPAASPRLGAELPAPLFWPPPSLPPVPPPPPPFADRPSLQPGGGSMWSRAERLHTSTEFPQSSTFSHMDTDSHAEESAELGFGALYGHGSALTWTRLIFFGLTVLPCLRRRGTWARRRS